MDDARKDGPRLRPRTRVRRAARLLLEDRLDDLAGWLPGARAGEAEAGIHQARVASKRLREGLRLFQGSYRAGRLREALAIVDLLNDALGPVRDADVMLQLLTPWLEIGNPLATEVAAHWGERRAQDHAELVARLDVLAEDAFTWQLRAVIRDGRRGRGHAVAGQSLARFVRPRLEQRKRAVRRSLGRVRDLRDGDQLHRVRVANKRLRYVLEPFIGLLDDEGLRLHAAVLDLHTLLGRIHDLDVLNQRIGTAEEARAHPKQADALLDEIRIARLSLHGPLTRLLADIGPTLLDKRASTVSG